MLRQKMHLFLIEIRTFQYPKAPYWGLCFILLMLEHLVPQQINLILTLWATAYTGHSNLEIVISITHILENCLADVHSWMNVNKLKLNPSKTEFCVFGSKQQLQKCSLQSNTLAFIQMRHCHIRNKQLANARLHYSILAV